MNKIDWAGIVIVVFMFALAIACIALYASQPTQLMVCPKQVCEQPEPVEIDCSKVVLDTINEAEVLKQTIKRISQ